MVGTPRCTTICHGQAGAPLVRVGAADGSAWGMSWWAVGKARRLCDGIYSRAGLGALDWGGSRCVASGGGLPGSATAQLHSSTVRRHGGGHLYGGVVHAMVVWAAIVWCSYVLEVVERRGCTLAGMPDLG